MDCADGRLDCACGSRQNVAASTPSMNLYVNDLGRIHQAVNARRCVHASRWRPRHRDEVASIAINQKLLPEFKHGQHY